MKYASKIVKQVVKKCDFLTFYPYDLPSRFPFTLCLYDFPSRFSSRSTFTPLHAKSQVTIKYDDDKTPICIDAIVVSTQHDDFDEDNAMLAKIKKDVQDILIPRVRKQVPQKIQHLFDHGYKLHVNPTGKFVIGGPHGDTGLTGRKIIVDTYGGRGAHGGGAFSGKDPSKVDRSAAYATRHIAKNMVAAGIADEVLVQVAYAIGVAEPVGLFINTFGSSHVKNGQGIILKDSEIAGKISNIFDLRPYAILKRLGLKNPIYLPTASYGHFGRDHYTKDVEVFYQDAETFKKLIDGKEKTFKTVEFFTWEKLDYVDLIKKEFGI